MTLLVSSFYRLFPLEDETRSSGAKYLEDLAELNGVRGLIVLSPEGLNATLAGEDPNLRRFVLALQAWFQTGELQEKLSRSGLPPFRKFLVKNRSEIVTSDFPTKDLVLSAASSSLPERLSPDEWQELLNSGEPLNVLDVRNIYEVAIGRFRGAVDPRLEQFTDFPDFVQQAELPRDRKTLIYCTGGIRCEKAIFELKAAGFEEVFQLDGGILNYLEKYPNSQFEGECFVFDDRVALNQELQPTGRYEFCPECGSPAERSDEGQPACRFCTQDLGALKI